MNAEQLKELRLKIGLSVAKASQQVHLSARQWNRYEAGTRSIPESIIELFCIKNNIEYPIAKERT